MVIEEKGEFMPDTEILGGSLGDPPPDDPKKESHNPGRAIYKKKLEEYQGLSPEEKSKALRETWGEIAMAAALRAKQLVATCSVKDFGRLQQIINAGSTAVEKAFPKEERSVAQQTAPQFIVQLFGSLGQGARAIAAPQTPIVINPPPPALTSQPPKEGE